MKNAEKARRWTTMSFMKMLTSSDEKTFQGAVEEALKTEKAVKKQLGKLHLLKTVLW
jgi:hypothetical protein